MKTSYTPTPLVEGACLQLFNMRKVLGLKVTDAQKNRFMILFPAKGFRYFKRFLILILIRENCSFLIGEKVFPYEILKIIGAVEFLTASYFFMVFTLAK